MLLPFNSKFHSGLAHMVSSLSTVIAEKRSGSSTYWVHYTGWYHSFPKSIWVKPTRWCYCRKRKLVNYILGKLDVLVRVNTRLISLNCMDHIIIDLSCASQYPLYFFPISPFNRLEITIEGIIIFTPWTVFDRSLNFLHCLRCINLQKKFLENLNEKLSIFE